MKTIRKKNSIILASGESVGDESLKKYFLNNKTNITHYSIMSEFWYSTNDYKISSVSLCKSLAISDKTLRNKICDLENEGYFFSFKFSLAENKSTVYYVINLSGLKVNYFRALKMLMDNFVELREYTLITNPNKNITYSNGCVQTLEQIYKLLKDGFLKGLRVSKQTKLYFLQVLYGLFENRLQEISQSDDDGFKLIFNETI